MSSPMRKEIKKRSRTVTRMKKAGTSVAKVLPVSWGGEETVAANYTEQPKPPSASVKEATVYLSELKALLKYRFDSCVSSKKGQSVYLMILGMGICLISATFYSHVNDSRLFSEALWEAWTYMADPGSHAKATRPVQRIFAFFITITGILFFSVIMGLVVDGIREKMDNLKKGKSIVVERDHSLLLGWTDKSICLIKEICSANASDGGGIIVVLADQEKDVLEAELKSQMKKKQFQGTKIVFRTGNPLLLVDLLKVSAHKAKSIVILSENGDADRSDAAILRVILSLRGLPSMNGYIVAEVRDIDNEPLVRLVGGDKVETLISHDVIGRLVLMSARSPGLAKVYNSILGFEGDEFYLKEWPECYGLTFGSLLERFPDAIVIGIKNSKNEIHIMPPTTYIIKPGDSILVIAEDDDTYKPCSPITIAMEELPVLPAEKKEKEKILLCGWRRDIRDMISLLDSMVLAGTEVHMACEQPVASRNHLLLENGLDVESLLNIELIHFFANTAVRRHVETLPIESYTSILILADHARESDIMHSDSHSLATLLLIRDLQARRKFQAKKEMFGPNIAEPISKWIKLKNDQCSSICEILDPRTQRTISSSSSISESSEFIQSNELISCILAMISESREVVSILDELLGVEGCSFAVKSSKRYCKINEELSFWQLAKRCQMFGEILCGYQCNRTTESTIINPKDKSLAKIWVDIDLIILKQDKAPKGTFVPNRRKSIDIKDICHSFEDTALQRRAKDLATWEVSKARMENAASYTPNDDLGSWIKKNQLVEANHARSFCIQKNDAFNRSFMMPQKFNDLSMSSLSAHFPNNFDNFDSEQKQNLRQLALGLLKALED